MYYNGNAEWCRCVELINPSAHVKSMTYNVLQEIQQNKPVCINSQIAQLGNCEIPHKHTGDEQTDGQTGQYDFKLQSEQVQLQVIEKLTAALTTDYDLKPATSVM